MWSDDFGRDSCKPVNLEEEYSWRWRRGVRFRNPRIFAGLLVYSLPSDVERNLSGLLAYRDKIVLRDSSWQHPGFAPDEAFVAGYVDEDGCLSGRRSY